MSKKASTRKKTDIPKVKSELSPQLINRLREGLFIITSALGLFILVALFSYSPKDLPSFNGGANIYATGAIHNAGGKVGAWLAEGFFYIFGYVAYLLPFMFAISAWLYLRSKLTEEVNHGLWISLRGVGFVFVLVACSSIASLQFADFGSQLPHSSGGVLGQAVSLSLVNLFNPGGTTLILLALLTSGITLFTGFSWLILVDGIGKMTLKVMGSLKTMCQQKLHHYRFQYEQWRIAQSKARELRQQQQKKPVLKVAINKSKVTPANPIINKANPKTLPLEKPPLKIETPNAQVKQSLRAQKDKQVPLFDADLKGTLPSLNLLDPLKPSTVKGYSHQQLEDMSREVEMRLKDFGIEVHVVAVHPGPVITRFEIDLAPGIKVSRISGLAKDLARSLSVISVRIVEVIPGKSVVGVELPNADRETVMLTEVLSSQQYEQSKSALALALGKDISGHPVIADLAKMPHLLVAGTTGSGKSVGVNAMLMGLLYKALPEDVRLILVDPKMLELSIYEGIPHLLTPVVTDMKEAASALRWCVAEMERRYRLMSALGVRNLAGCNTKIKEAQKINQPILDPIWKGEEEQDRPVLEKLPYIVVVIDEYADMMMVVGKKVEQLIARIAQKARAAGIHLILATQRPSVDVITGLIKANIPSRIAFQVSSKIDSRTVLDQAGAEQLLGHGDMLYLPGGTSVPVRVHGAFVSDDEVHRVVDDWKRRGEPDYIEAIISQASDAGGDGSADSESNNERDELFDEAVFVVTKTRKASISSIQRRLKIGYNRAARLVEEMEEQGIVSPMESNGSREVLAPPPPEQ